MIQPIGKRILVRRTKPKEATDAGIIIPEESRERTHRGEVVRCGDDSVNLNVGDTVLIAKHGGVDVESDGEEYALLEADEIIGVYGDTPAPVASINIATGRVD